MGTSTMNMNMGMTPPTNVQRENALVSSIMSNIQGLGADSVVADANANSAALDKACIAFTIINLI
jgi:hypothetical protein